MSSLEVLFFVCVLAKKRHFLCVCKKSQIYYLDLRVMLEMKKKYDTSNGRSKRKYMAIV
jgi:hypothetical protein